MEHLMNRHLFFSLAQMQSTLSLFKLYLERRFKIRLFQTSLLLFSLGIGLSLAIASCSSPETSAVSSGNQPEVTLNLVSFSVTQAAHDKIIPKFVEKWRQEHNQTLVIKPSYGGSGAQTRAVIENGIEADVVHLSLAPDVQKLEQAGLIQPGWEQEFPSDSVVSRSVVAIVTREGNPKSIKTWADLANNGVSVVTPNPKTSGGARWNFLALWDAALKARGNESQALDFVTKVYKNAPILPDTAREATNAFFSGTGDVLLTYENEVILKELSGEKVPYSIPDINFSIDNPVAIVDKNADKHGTREMAKAFIEYLYSPEAQQEFVGIGYRPSDSSILKDKTLSKKYPVIKTLATAKDYGGWADIQKKFFDESAIFDKVLGER
jgi:sulfate/thiosulfate transport system substrate-binding protein